MEYLPKKSYRSPGTCLRLSAEEASGLDVREFRCPVCNFRIESFFSDISGHLRVKCPKCKGIFTVNVAYFRKRKKK